MLWSKKKSLFPWATRESQDGAAPVIMTTPLPAEWYVADPQHDPTRNTYPPGVGTLEWILRQKICTQAACSTKLEVLLGSSSETQQRIRALRGGMPSQKLNQCPSNAKQIAI